MNNLKRVLSLGLSGAMLAGMVTIGASAVNGSDFTDADEITHNEAVNTLVTLNVINGKDDGSYDPSGSLTRAEMAKLIVYVLNGGVEPVMSTKATPTYTDIGGHWAEKYIEYCSNLNIVSGQGDGTFNPDGTLTGSQAAKMMLTAMDYDSNVFGFTGEDWEISVNSEANKAGLYDDLKGLDPSATITRDSAAQLVYNGLLASTMKLTYSQSLSDGKVTQNYELTGPTLFSSKFSGTAYEGVLTTSGKYAIADTASKDYFTIQQTKIDNLELDTNTTVVAGTPKSFKYAGVDLTALAGESVKVLYNSKDRTVYGVYSVADNNTVVVNTTSNKVGDETTDEIEIGDDTYTKGSGYTVVGTIDTDAADNLKAVDNDGDGKLDYIIVQPVGVAKVTFVGSDSVTLAAKGGNATLTASNQKTDDMIVYDGVAKGDYVVFYKDLYTNKDVIEKAELVEATISGVGGSSSNKFQIDGTWYKAGTNSTIYSTPAVGDTLKMIALDNKIYYAEKVNGSQSVENLVMLITGDTSSTMNGAQAKLLFSDGTVGTVTVDSTTSSEVKDANVGKLFTYETTNSGEYKLTAATTGCLGSDYTWNASGNVSGTPIDTVGTYSIADDAIVYLSALSAATLNTSNKGKIITGKELKALSVGVTTSTIKAATNGFFVSKSNGLTRATILCVTVGAAASNFDALSGTSTNNYGYLVSDATYTKEDGTSYISLQVWNGEETVSVKWANSSASTAYKSYTKHTIIGYDTKSDDEITNVMIVDNITETTAQAPLTTGAITGLDGKEISFSTATGTGTFNGSQVAANAVLKLTGDTKYLYVDSNASSAKAIGVAEADLQVATEPVDGVYVENVRYLAKKVGSELQIELIIYDVNNKLANRTKTSDITPEWDNGVAAVIINDVEYTSGKVKIAVGDMVKVVAAAGKTVTVTSTNTKLVSDFAAGTLINTVTAVSAKASSDTAESVVFTLTDASDTVTITAAATA